MNDAKLDNNEAEQKHGITVSIAKQLPRSLFWKNIT